MKVVSSIGNLKNRAKNCQIVKRRDRIYLISKTNPRFKVRQGRGTKKRRK